jgi:O-antigen ligase
VSKGRSNRAPRARAAAATAGAAAAAEAAEDGAALPRFKSLSPADKLLVVLLWLLVLLPPWWTQPAAKDSFRLPKQMLAEWLALATLLPLAWALRRVEVVRLAAIWRLAAVRAVAPLLAVATVSAATSSHPLHVHDALVDLWIGCACLVGWSAGVPRRRLGRLLGGLLVPAVLLAVYGILQFHHVLGAGVGRTTMARLAIVSFAGNPGDLAAFLVLPCLAAQWLLARAAPGRRGLLLAALAVCTYGLAITQTVAALAALLLGSLLLWGRVLGRTAAGRRNLAWTAAALGGLGLVALLAAAAVPALRGRMQEKLGAARRGDWNEVLTGRIDGWRTALWMLDRHPLAGVGHGAFRAEFAAGKLALIDRGVVFYAGQQQNFVNAHDEPLEVAADLGWPGLAALAWGLWVVLGALRARLRRPQAEAPPGDGSPAAAAAPAADGALALAGTAALAVLSLVDFPFRIALVAFPALLFLAWLLAGAAPAGEGEEAAA